MQPTWAGFSPLTMRSTYEAKRPPDSVADFVTGVKPAYSPALAWPGLTAPPAPFSDEPPDLPPVHPMVPSCRCGRGSSASNARTAAASRSISCSVGRRRWRCPPGHRWCSRSGVDSNAMECCRRAGGRSCSLRLPIRDSASADPGHRGNLPTLSGSCLLLTPPPSGGGCTCPGLGDGIVKGTSGL